MTNDDAPDKGKDRISNLHGDPGHTLKFLCAGVSLETGERWGEACCTCGSASFRAAGELGGDVGYVELLLSAWADITHDEI